MQATSNAVENSSVNIVQFPKRERCVIIPAETLYTVGQYEISPGVKWLYTILRSHTNTKGECRVYQETLAEESGQTVRTVRRQLCELRQAGLLLRERKGQGRANHYEVTMAPVRPAKNGHSSKNEEPSVIGQISATDRPKIVKRLAKNGRSYSEQIAEQEVKQASSACLIINSFQKFTFPEECKRAFLLHREKNTLSRFLEILEELEKRNQPIVFSRVLEKYLLKGENGDIYPGTIMRDYLWKEMAQETEFDRQEEILEKEKNQVEETAQSVEEEQWESQQKAVKEQKTRLLNELRVTVQEIQKAVLEQDQSKIRNIVTGSQNVLNTAKMGLSDTPEWKQYRECLLMAGFMPVGRGKGCWGKPGWNSDARRFTALQN